ncbi:MAG TPA: ABC transporter substrate-binding protein [Spirochaetia bacterium]|nr:ABC transporter substrate-binding protein [Spirochaetia bacterium]
MKRLIALLFMVLVLNAGLVFSEGGRELTGKLLIYGTTEKITDMDPSNAYDFHTWELFQNISKGLLMYKPGTTELVPGLAESYTVNTLGDEYTFKLRRGLRFTDGTPFTSGAVKWSIDRVMRIKGDPSWLVTDFVDSVSVVDDYTVRFKLKGPVGFFPALVASVPYFPVNPNIYPPDRYIKDPAELKGGALVGLGPYKAISFKRDEEIDLEANPSYFGPKPNVDRIVIRYFADATTMRLALEKQEVDLVYKDLNPSDKQDLSKNTQFMTYNIPGAQIRYLCFESSEGLFADKRLRKAVGALIDRPEIVRKVYLDQNAPLYSMVPMGMVYHTEDFKTDLGDGNLNLANTLLASAGYTPANPLKMELWYTPSHYGDTEVNLAEVLKAQFEKSPAVKVALKSAEWATYIANMDTKQMKVFLLGWYPDYIDPDNYTAAFAGTSGSAGLGIYFSKPEWDALFKVEQTAADPNVRKATFEKIQKMWTDECPTIPIFQGNLFVFTNKNVRNVKIGPTMIFNYDTLFVEQ